MPCLLWDASALVKRYAPEVGTATVNALFALPAVPMTITYLGYAEVCAVLRRKHNRGAINIQTFQTARQAVEQEILLAPAVEMLTIDDSAILLGIGLTDTHHINTADAAILATFLRYSPLHDPQGSSRILVAADQHLVRAAKAEGLAVLDPEAVVVSDLAAFLSGIP